MNTQQIKPNEHSIEGEKNIINIGIIEANSKIKGLIFFTIENEQNNNEEKDIEIKSECTAAGGGGTPPEDDEDNKDIFCGVNVPEKLKPLVKDILDGLVDIKELKQSKKIDNSFIDSALKFVKKVIKAQSNKN